MKKTLKQTSTYISRIYRHNKKFKSLQKKICNGVLYIKTKIAEYINITRYLKSCCAHKYQHTHSFNKITNRSVKEIAVNWDCHHNNSVMDLRSY